MSRQLVTARPLGGPHHAPSLALAAPRLRRAITRRWLVTAGLLAAILGLYAWLLAPQLGKPFVYDDVNFALGACAIAETGLPYGNQGYLLHLYEQREQWALWHPPLYLYALGLTVALFGPSEAATRGLGVLCQLVTAVLTFDLGRRLAIGRAAPAAAATVAGVLAVALFLLNPLTVQAALVLDIDNTVLMTLVSIFVWSAVQRPGRWRARAVGGFAMLYAVLLWTKLTTPLILLAALVFTRLFGRAGGRRALEAVAAGLLGSILFLVTWFGITAVSGMPHDYTFDVMFREAMDSQASTRDRFTSLAAFASGSAPAILWLGPFFCVLFLIAGLPRLWKLLRGRGLHPDDLVVVLGAAIYLLYIMKLAGNFPKYHAAAIPLWAAASAALVVRFAGRPTYGQLAVAAMGAVAVAAWLIAQAPTHWGIQYTPGLVRLLIVVPAISGLAIVALWAQLGRVSAFHGLPVALAGLTLAWSLALNLHHRSVVGSTTYYYGRHGHVEVAQALGERLGPDELYIAAKEVAWYTPNKRYVDQESWHHVVFDLGRGFDGRWLGEEVRLLALEVGEPSFKASYEQLLHPRYQLVAQHNNFVLLERGAYQPLLVRVASQPERAHGLTEFTKRSSLDLADPLTSNP